MKNPGESPCRPPRPPILKWLSLEALEEREEIICHTGKEYEWERVVSLSVAAPKILLPCWGLGFKVDYVIIVCFDSQVFMLPWSEPLAFTGSPIQPPSRIHCMWFDEYLIHQAPQTSLIIALSHRPTMTFRSLSEGEGKHLCHGHFCWLEVRGHS